MAHDSTMKLVTNMDRAAIEGLLAKVRMLAQAKGQNELAQMFAGIEGMPRAQIETSVKNALKWLAGKEGMSDISGPLELVELNLPNLK
ncbi:MAG: hypothetical protein AB7O31_03285 [Burkholderiales bacterium]